MSTYLAAPVVTTVDAPHIVVSPGWLRLADAVLPHQPAEGGCKCGWRISDYDWPVWGDKTEAERWVEHVRQEATRALPPTEAVYIYDGDGVQHVLSTDSVVVHHLFHWPGMQSCREDFAAFRGAYNLPDWQPPALRPNEVSTTRLTCPEAGCRDPHCLGGHFTFSMEDVVRAAHASGEADAI
jgi:hypothetical protein